MTTSGIRGVLGIAALIVLLVPDEVTAQAATPRDRAFEIVRMNRICMAMTAGNRHYVDVPVAAREAYCRCSAAYTVDHIPLAVLRGPGTPAYDGVIKAAARACYRPLVPYLKD